MKLFYKTVLTALVVENLYPLFRNRIHFKEQYQVRVRHFIKERRSVKQKMNPRRFFLLAEDSS